MTSNRWVIAAAGTVAMACLGTVYSWSLFTQPLIAAFGWSNTTTTWTFALAILFLGIGAVIGGRWQDAEGAAAGGGDGPRAVGTRERARRARHLARSARRGSTSPTASSAASGSASAT